MGLAWRVFNSLALLQGTQTTTCSNVSLGKHTGLDQEGVTATFGEVKELEGHQLVEFKCIILHFEQVVGAVIG